MAGTASPFVAVTGTRRGIGVDLGIKQPLGFR
jgi:hypothetical protein